MIVDDDSDLCHALGLRLRANHYKTLSTGDGLGVLTSSLLASFAGGESDRDEKR